MALTIQLHHVTEHHCSDLLFCSKSHLGRTQRIFARPTTVRIPEDDADREADGHVERHSRDIGDDSIDPFVFCWWLQGWIHIGSIEGDTGRRLAHLALLMGKSRPHCHSISALKLVCSSYRDLASLRLIFCRSTFYIHHSSQRCPQIEGEFFFGVSKLADWKSRWSCL